MVFLTSSRGGFVGLLAAGMVFVYRRRGLAGAVTVLLVLLGGVLLLPTDLGDAGAGHDLPGQRPAPGRARAVQPGARGAVLGGAADDRR